MRLSLSIATLTALAAALFCASAARTQDSADLSPLAPPPSQHVVLTVTGAGVQIYACRQADTGLQWALQAPEAKLTDADGKIVGTHAAGPVWISQDGSSVRGEVLQKKASPDSGAIPWLLLEATTVKGPGVFEKVEFIRRSDTHGGVAPTTGCDAQHRDATARVRYSATYTFYSAKP